MTDEEFKEVGAKSLRFVQDKVPNPKTRYVRWYRNPYGNWQRGSTGNLALNATKIEFISEKEFLIGVDKDVAPYMPYTNEPWISPKWKGHKNPNEKWFDRTTKELALYLKEITGGTIEI